MTKAVKPLTPLTYSVSELTNLLKEEIETKFASVWVHGEVSNLKRQSSGHIYFSLKDASSQLGATIWNSTAQTLPFQMDNGMEVLASGDIQLYAPHGKYQLICRRVEPLGIGELQLKFDALKKQLFDEGLFDASHKKPLPRFPKRIGIVTSPTGAVIQDIRSVLARRFPLAELILFPVKVQGEGAKEEIAKAITYFNITKNKKHQTDVLIVGRGGGSIEDLWPFNEEVVARAIYKSEIPVISAVGHEVDFTIADFAADYRAATPSMAAEISAPSSDEVMQLVLGYTQIMHQKISSGLFERQARVSALVGSYAFNRPLREVDTIRQSLDNLTESLDNKMRSRMLAASEKTQNLTHRLRTLGTASILNRGFTMVFKDGKAVRRAAELASGDAVQVRFADDNREMRIL
jgi:exodeoxyribonuclease VII large subunit